MSGMTATGDDCLQVVRGPTLTPGRVLSGERGG